MKEHKGGISSILISPCNKFVISGCTSGDMITWELETGDVIQHNNDAGGEISSMKFFNSFDGDLHVISCNKSGKACVYSEAIFYGNDDYSMS